MAWNFQPTKFRNTTPKLPKKENTIHTQIGGLSLTNNGIQASSSHLAFAFEGEGGKLGILPVDAKGRFGRNEMSIVHAHVEQLDDFGFFPFDASLLTTCARNDSVKLWKIGDTGDGPSLEGRTQPHHLWWHTRVPTRVMSSIGSRRLLHTNSMASSNKDCRVAGLTMVGVLAVACDKGHQAMIWDVRAGPQAINTFATHEGIGREGRILFAGDKLVTSGFTNKRIQEILVFDHGKWDAPIHREGYTATTGVLIPIYDRDTKLLFLAGKGTNRLQISEILTNAKAKGPIVSPVFELTLPEQLLGACIGQKSSMNVMEGEVAVFYELHRNGILPIPCIVPRRSYRDFQPDLFPETRGTKAGCSAEQWKSGNDHQPALISLDPTGGKAPEAQTQAPAAQVPNTAEPEAKPEPATIAPAPRSQAPAVAKSDNIDRQSSPTNEKENVVTPPSKVADSVPAVQMRAPISNISGITPRKAEDTSRYRKSVIGTITSKFRNTEVLTGNKADNAVFSNLKDVNTRLSLETNGACVSKLFAAIPLSGTGGRIQILDLEKFGKLPDGVVDSVYCKRLVTDLHWNPFDPTELGCATDEGSIVFWKFSKEDGPRNEMEPSKIVKLSGDKILNFSFHPLAKDILAVSFFSGRLQVWNVADSSLVFDQQAHNGAVMGVSWSYDGKKLVTIGKDLFARVWSPLTGDLVLEEKCLESNRGGRVLFVCEDQGILVISFTKASGRQVALYDANDFSLKAMEPLTSGVQPIFAHYDYDSSIVFLFSKGERQINMYELSWDKVPYFLPVLPYSATTGFTTIAFNDKKSCDLMNIEFQRAWRLTEKTFELLIFRVPRIKKDVFQDDLFPDALVSWEPVMEAKDWIDKSEQGPVFRNLRPDGVASANNNATVKAPIKAPTSTPLPKEPIIEEKIYEEEKPSQKQTLASWGEAICAHRDEEEEEAADQSPQDDDDWVKM
ncbi:unnamed protein product, partial [Mesorhabditis spiculigera]